MQSVSSLLEAVSVREEFSAKGPDSSVGGVPVVHCPDNNHMEEEVQLRVQVEEERMEETRGEEQGKEQRVKERIRCHLRYCWGEMGSARSSPDSRWRRFLIVTAARKSDPSRIGAFLPDLFNVRYHCP